MPDGPFGDCKRAKLHLIGHVQASGALIAIDKRSHLICGCSENTTRFLDKSPEELIGQPWQTVLRPEHVGTAFMPADAPDAVLHQIHKTAINDTALLIANHSVALTTLVEIERCQPERVQFNSADVIAFLRSLTETSTAESAARLLMHTVAAITEFDRVMLYKFLPGWHGEVIAEVARPGIGSFLGLRFPETDVPTNARLLYLCNWKRAIDDIEAPTVPLLLSPDYESLDLTYSHLRAVHPAHVQYLKNIGTRASFSISIISSGRLWGLVACHHLSPRKISFERQMLCEKLSRTTSIHVSDMDMMQSEKSRSAYREAKAEMRGELRAHEHAKRSIATQFETMRAIFKASGVWAHLDGQHYYSGQTPDEASLKLLRDVLATYPGNDVTVCSTIPPELAEHKQLVHYASGFLYLPLTDGDFLVLLRLEQVETINWAGKPQMLETDASTPLTPRASFQKWSQLVRGASDPWYEVDIEAASRLRELLIEYVNELHLEGLALRDQLTGLANRHLFEQKLAEVNTAEGARDRLTAIYMLDLDKFKPVNDTMGHAAGDALLAQVAGRLRDTVRESDVVARLGGDEFAVIQYNLPDAAGAEHTAQRILSEIRRPFSILGKDIEIGISIGIAFSPPDTIEGAELLHLADLALYQAKNAGRNCFRIFKQHMAVAKR